MKLFVTVVFLLVAGGYLYFRARGRWLLNPVPIFVLGQVLMFTGSLPLLDMSIEADVVHLWVMLWALVGIVVGATVAEAAFPVRQHLAAWREEPTRAEADSGFEMVVIFLVLLSILVTFAYYRAAGTNIFLASLQSFVATGRGVEGATELREVFYAGEKYLAPGYVNQFKNLILPLFTAYYWFRYYLRRSPSDRVVGWCLVPVSVLALLGTGQRGAFADFVLIAACFGLAALPVKVGRRFVTILAGVGLALFSLATFFLGRGALSSGQVRGDTVGGVLLEVWERAVWGNQMASVAGFRYIYQKDAVWGQDWLTSIMSVVPRSLFPNKPVSTLNLEIFETLFYSRSGTAPPSVWGSVWYNFGPLGMTLIPIVIGALYYGLYVRAVRGPKLLARLAVWSGLVIILGMWLAGGVEALLNRGLLALLLLSVLVRLRAGRSRQAAAFSSAAAPAHPPPPRLPALSDG